MTPRRGQGLETKNPATPKYRRGKIFQSGPGATRTRDLLLRRQALYPTELRTLCGTGKVDPQPSFRNCWPRNAKTPFRPPSTPGDSSQPRPPPAARGNTQNGNQDHRDREDRCALGARSARGDLPSTRTNARHMPSTLPNPTAVAMCRRSRDDDWSGRRAASTRRWSTYFAGVVPTSAVNTRAPGAPRRSHTPSRPCLSAGLARSRTRGLRVAHRRRAENYRFKADRGFAEPGLLDRIPMAGEVDRMLMAPTLA
jgi:hypothetical protein